MLDLKAIPLLRKNMDVFIRADPVMIALQRFQKQETEAGGFIYGPVTPLDPQQFRIGWFKRRLYEYTMTTANGNIPILQYMLIGRWNVDLLRDDEFDYGPDHYIVDSVEPKTDDRTKTDRVVGILRVEVGDKAPPESP